MNAWLKYSDFVCFFKRCNFKRYYDMMNSWQTNSLQNIVKTELGNIEFSGDETIIEEGTSMIHLNSLNLTIDSIYAKRCGNKEYSDLGFEFLLDIEQIKIYFPEVLYKENLDLRIRFHGKLSMDPFDLTSLSTAEIKVIDKMDDGTKKVNYESTIHMSTYLVAFVVGDLEYIEGITSNGKTRMRVHTVKGRRHRADFALKVGVVAVDYLNKYFDMDYPLTKMDMVSIPFFNSGAMENTGLLLYKPNYLLMNSDKRNMFSIASVVAHEIAHQWFGNIITMNWWNQLWLKEGFASYFKYEVPVKFYPELNVKIY
uniref:Peptidase_M1 domain-containing protein n=1 Tax=Parastrongyloides trichosuri TaxID=131310 RepID=A0A0N4Z086_PARTI